MPRNRKPLDLKTRNLTVRERETLQISEKSVSGPKLEIYHPPSMLINTLARKEYLRLVGLLDEIDIVSDIDINNLAMYCNAFAAYCDVTKQLKKQKMTVYNANMEEKPNPLITIQVKYMEECRRMAATCGLTIDSRLKVGQAKVAKMETDIKGMFGDI